MKAWRPLATSGIPGQRIPEIAPPPPRLPCMPGLPSQEPTPQPHIQLSFPRAPAPSSCHGHIAFLRGMCPTMLWGSFFSVVGATGGVGSTASGTI